MIDTYYLKYVAEDDTLTPEQKRALTEAHIMSVSPSGGPSMEEIIERDVRSRNGRVGEWSGTSFF